MTNKQTTPKIAVDTYGHKAPDAADFLKGARTLADVEKATAARRDQKPAGQYRNDD